MSYTPPAYNEADLVFVSGYAVPANDEADLSFATGVPIFSFVGTTTTSFFGKVDKVSDFAISASSTAQFEHWSRKFVIAASSTVSFVTWQRAFALESSAVTSFQPGFIASFPCSTTPAFVLIGTRQCATNINGVSVWAPAWTSTNNVVFTSAGHTYTSFAKTDNQPRRFVGWSVSELTGRSSASASAAFAGAGGGAFSPRSISTLRAAFSCETVSTLSADGRTALPSTATFTGASEAAFASVFGQATYSTIGATASGAFASSYLQNPTYPALDPDMAIYVVTKGSTVYARN